MKLSCEAVLPSAHAPSLPSKENSHVALFPRAPSNLLQLYKLDESQELGHGCWGIVRVCTLRKTGQKWACKTVMKSSLPTAEDVAALLSEVAAMQDLENQLHVVQLKEVFEDERSVHLIMELCDGGDLFDKIVSKGMLLEDEAKVLFRQIVRGVAACHGRGWMHCDLKPENVLLSKSGLAGEGVLPQDLTCEQEGLFLDSEKHCEEAVTVKLADFGLAVDTRKGKNHGRIAGSPFYMAPELVKGQPYGMHADVWSLGVVLHTMLAGAFPFNGNTTEDVFSSIKKGRLTMAGCSWQTISPEAKHLIRQMLQMDPTKRPRISELLDHPWISEASMNEPARTSPLKKDLHVKRGDGEESRRFWKGGSKLLWEVSTWLPALETMEVPSGLSAALVGMAQSAASCFRR